MLKRFLMHLSTKAGLKDSEKYLAWLKCMTDGEVSAVLCCTGMARMSLRETKIERWSFPDAEFSGLAPVSAATAGRISRYNMELVRVRKRLQATSTAASELTASGMTILILSLRALANPELFVGGRHLWSELKRGIDGWQEHMETLAPHVAISPQRLAEVWLFPNALAPDIPPWNEGLEVGKQHHLTPDQARAASIITRFLDEQTGEPFPGRSAAIAGFVKEQPTDWASAVAHGFISPAAAAMTLMYEPSEAGE